MFSEEMSANFVVENTNHSTLAILAGKLDVHLALARLWIMGHTCGGNLVLLEVDRDPLLNAEILQVVSDVIMSLILIQLLALSVKVSALRPILLEEAVQDLLGDSQILPIWLIKLLEELLSELSIFIFELRVNLEI
jgi:hypothetical protein